jgi:hypothetical protein
MLVDGVSAGELSRRYPIRSMFTTLEQFVLDFAAAIQRADAQRPVACNARSGAPYQCGIGPHTESATLDLALAEMQQERPDRYSPLVREVPYPGLTRQKCDLCFGTAPAWEWCIEVKMLRLMGDSGKPNDNMLMHILSPYPGDRSAVTDCEKLSTSTLTGRKAIVIFGYEYNNYLCEPAIRAFELLASKRVTLGQRVSARFKNLVHPVHTHGQVHAWNLLPTDDLRLARQE